MKNLEIFQINKRANLKEAMQAITANMRGIIFVTENKKVIGVLSDGDIRRTLLRGVTLLAPISSIMNTNFVFVTNNNKKIIQQIMLERGVTAVPVLDKNGKMRNIVFIDEIKNRE
jgi:CBS domain-containing protein